MSLYERIQAGESPWDDDELVRTLLRNTSDGLLTIDEESRIVFANPAIEDVLGYEPDELIGSSKMRIIPERLQSAHQESFDRYLETGEKHIDWDGFELPALHKEGHEVPVSIRLREHEYDGERLVTGIFTDVTERKRRERRLREQKEELEEFAAVLSHDLRNPLSVAQGYTDLARERTDADELVRVEQALDRIEEIVDDTLARMREAGDELGAEELSLGEVMRDAWGSVVTPDAALVLPDESWRIRAHAGYLKQLAENLFRNSIEHGGPGVTVRVGVLDDGEGFYVADDGPGLPEDLRDRTWLPDAFDPAESRGYGLHIVERVADDHGWELFLTDSAEGGARFEFRGADLTRE